MDTIRFKKIFGFVYRFLRIEFGSKELDLFNDLLKEEVWTFYESLSLRKQKKPIRVIAILVIKDILDKVGKHKDDKEIIALFKERNKITTLKKVNKEISKEKPRIGERMIKTNPFTEKENLVHVLTRLKIIDLTPEEIQIQVEVLKEKSKDHLFQDQSYYAYVIFTETKKRGIKISQHEILKACGIVYNTIKNMINFFEQDV